MARPNLKSTFEELEPDERQHVLPAAQPAAVSKLPARPLPSPYGIEQPSQNASWLRAGIAGAIGMVALGAMVYLAGLIATLLIAVGIAGGLAAVLSRLLDDTVDL